MREEEKKEGGREWKGVMGSERKALRTHRLSSHSYFFAISRINVFE